MVNGRSFFSNLFQNKRLCARMLEMKGNFVNISQPQQRKLATQKVAIIGAGGLGGYVAEFCARLQIGNLVIVDKDVFDESNLLRQLFSNTDTLGKNKAQTAVQAVKLINPQCNAVAVKEYFCKENAEAILVGCDCVVDALDNIADRLQLEKSCAELKIPLISGAVNGQVGQVTTVLPNDNTLSGIYLQPDCGTHNVCSVPPYLVSSVASFQCAELLNCLVGKPKLRKKVLILDFNDMSLHKIKL